MSIIFKYMVKDKDKKKDCSLKVQRVKIDEEKLHELEHGVWKFPSSHALIGHTLCALYRQYRVDAPLRLLLPLAP